MEGNASSVALIDFNNMIEIDNNEKEFEELEYMKDNIENEKDKIVEKKTDEPMIGMVFDTVDEMFNFYASYGKSLGFPVKRRTCKKGNNGELKYVTFVCARSGKSVSKSNNSLKPYPNTKIGCNAKVCGGIYVDGKWRINSFVRDHNHGLSPSKARFFRCNREISSHVKRQLEVNDRAGIRVNKNYNSFVVEAGGHANLSFMEKDCRNYIEKLRRLRLGEGDAMAIQSYFLKMQAQDANFFYSMDLDDDGRLKNVFWADSRSRACYKEFGDVITFDTTYLTNKYDMPFAPFVGVNHHGQSILLGCGLISSEDTNTFIWLFQTWLACMSGHAPSGIITDQDKAMQKAIEIVFSNARHRWCLWHIMKKLPEKLKSYKRYESIKNAMQCVVYDSQGEEEFEESWNVMIESYNLHNNEWLTGLYKERCRWVPSFVKYNFWAGMSTTQRSESMNAFFDGYVNAKTTLKQFVEQYDNALTSKCEKESQADAKSFSQQVPCVTIYDMEQQVQAVYTMNKFKEFQNELIGKMYCDIFSTEEDCMVSKYNVREVVNVGEIKKRKCFKVSFHRNEGEVKCNCSKFEFTGILCRHAIAVLILNDIYYIPEKYIIKRWRKDVRRCHTRVKINYDGWIASPEQLRYDKMCNAFTKVADFAAEDEENWISVMNWIDNSMREFSIKKRTCASSQSIPTLNVHGSSNKKISIMSNETTNILDPIVIRGKGRPPCKRKQSRVEQFVKRQHERKKNPMKCTRGRNKGVHIVETQESIVASQNIESGSIIGGNSFGGKKYYQAHELVVQKDPNCINSFSQNQPLDQVFPAHFDVPNSSFSNYASRGYFISPMSNPILVENVVDRTSSVVLESTKKASLDEN